MVTCCDCSVVQTGTDRCLACGGPVVPGGTAPRIEGWIPFRIDRGQALAALPDRWWKLPTAALLERSLTRCWLATWRCDVRLDTAWEAAVFKESRWALRSTRAARTRRLDR